MCRPCLEAIIQRDHRSRSKRRYQNAEDLADDFDGSQIMIPAQPWKPQPASSLRIGMWLKFALGRFCCT